MELMLIGVISTTRKVKIQLEAEASAAAEARMGRGEYSDGRSHWVSAVSC